MEGDAMCGCIGDYDSYVYDGSAYSLNSGSFFLNDAAVVCAADYPCLNSPCDTEDFMTCITETVDGLPTAFCQCLTNYEDPHDDDEKVLVENASR